MRSSSSGRQNLSGSTSPSASAGSPSAAGRSSSVGRLQRSLSGGKLLQFPPCPLPPQVQNPFANGGLSHGLQGFSGLQGISGVPLNGVTNMQGLGTMNGLGGQYGAPPGSLSNPLAGFGMGLGAGQHVSSPVAQSHSQLPTPSELAGKKVRKRVPVACKPCNKAKTSCSGCTFPS